MLHSWGSISGYVDHVLILGDHDIKSKHDVLVCHEYKVSISLRIPHFCQRWFQIIKSLKAAEWDGQELQCREANQPRVINSGPRPEMAKMIPQVRKYVSNRQTESQQLEILIQMWQICL
jgi:hypothetical protein